MFAKKGLISGKFPVENRLICNIGGDYMTPLKDPALPNKPVTLQIHV